LLASQQITHFPKTVLDNATNWVFLRVQADNKTRILRDFPALKPYAQELTRLEPGEGFVLGQEGVPWPFRVLEAPILEQRRG
ncbi:MAG: hypothetical protein K1Y36_30100, partial [Blastocatellia bacterium]|nr:hypothetical protein [Blastocatellia bacterium]